MLLLQMFIFKEVSSSDISTHQFEITGSTYAPEGEVWVLFFIALCAVACVAVVIWCPVEFAVCFVLSVHVGHAAWSKTVDDYWFITIIRSHQFRKRQLNQAPLNVRGLIWLLMMVWSKRGNINTAALVTVAQCNTFVARCSRQLIGPADWVFVTLGPLRCD